MSDPVNHPPHYKGAAGFEAIDVIEGFSLGFRLGNLVKYVLRAGRKGVSVAIDPAANLRTEIEDLKKGRWYLDREIAAKESAMAIWLKIERHGARSNRKYGRGRK